jgi:hypothetical protein
VGATHNLNPKFMGEDQVYWAPQPVLLLALTAGRRSIPLLPRALLSPSYMIEIFAVMGLAEIHDDASIPRIIQACQKLPANTARAMAESLV